MKKYLNLLVAVICGILLICGCDSNNDSVASDSDLEQSAGPYVCVKEIRHNYVDDQVLSYGIRFAYDESGKEIMTYGYTIENGLEIPKDFTDDVIEAIAICEKVCKLVHLPLQSGNTKVLKEMNRKYTKEQYLNLVEKMKSKIPNLTLSTDIIVGFPGETDEEFEDTLDVVRKVNFEQVYMFIYSRRVGTPGDRMENQVPEEIKHIRFNKLKQLVESQIQENNQKYVGTIEKVLVEGNSKNNEKMLTGRTDSNKVVIFEGDRNLIGNIITLKIVSEHMWYLKGEI